ncbi:DUF6221 family protein [Streptomyces sp. NBC_00178]|uniref:DUF6221 family protein n=1 Tax=Streptomyces sp. NBC_00178 TaxID=2975672 RepID=UPI002E2C9B98|nr:DUF6221 family protein [Streptomyces sp. NBC_00178]
MSELRPVRRGVCHASVFCLAQAGTAPASRALATSPRPTPGTTNEQADGHTIRRTGPSRGRCVPGPFLSRCRAGWAVTPHVLRDVEAKRRVLARHVLSPAIDDPELPWDNRNDSQYDGEDWPCPDLLDLALPHASHPDHRDQWWPHQMRTR